VWPAPFHRQRAVVDQARLVAVAVAGGVPVLLRHQRQRQLHTDRLGRNHTLYYGLTGFDNTDGGVNIGNLSVLVARSIDLGDHWQTAVAQLSRGKVAPDTVTARATSDHAVDTSGKEDVVYVTWRAE